jgi:hypothetical protein
MEFIRQVSYDRQVVFEMMFNFVNKFSFQMHLLHVTYFWNPEFLIGQHILPAQRSFHLGFLPHGSKEARPICTYIHE